MKSPRTATRIIISVACLAVVPAIPPAAGQDPGGGSKAGGGGAYRSLTDLEASYERQLTELERRKLADFGGLAGRLNGIEAENAFRAVFDLAVARGFTPRPSRRRGFIWPGKKANRRHRPWRRRSSLVAHADRGEFERSLGRAETVPRQPGGGPCSGSWSGCQRLDLRVGEAYLQRLIRGGRFDIARGLPVGPEQQAPRQSDPDLFRRASGPARSGRQTRADRGDRRRWQPRSSGRPQG